MARGLAVLQKENIRLLVAVGWLLVLMLWIQNLSLIHILKMPVTRGKTERPHGASLQLDIGFRYSIYRIGGRQRNQHASAGGVVLGIPLLEYWNSNLRP